MRLKFISVTDSYWGWNITFNKEYEVLRTYIEKGNTVYVVINDIGNEDHYNSTYFESPDNARERKLKTIGIN